MTRYAEIERAVDRIRQKFTSGNSVPVERATVFASEWNELEAALALPEDSKVVNAELYGLAVEFADEYVREEVELTCAVAKCMGDNSEFDTKAHAKELRYLSLREASGDPMPYKVIREGDKVRFE